MAEEESLRLTYAYPFPEVIDLGIDKTPPPDVTQGDYTKIQENIREMIGTLYPLLETERNFRKQLWNNQDAFDALELAINGESLERREKPQHDSIIAPGLINRFAFAKRQLQIATWCFPYIRSDERKRAMAENIYLELQWSLTFLLSWNSFDTHDEYELGSEYLDRAVDLGKLVGIYLREYASSEDEDEESMEVEDAKPEAMPPTIPGESEETDKKPPGAPSKADPSETKNQELVKFASPDEDVFPQMEEEAEGAKKTKAVGSAAHPADAPAAADAADQDFSPIPVPPVGPTTTGAGDGPAKPTASTQQKNPPPAPPAAAETAAEESRASKRGRKSEEDEMEEY